MKKLISTTLMVVTIFATTSFASANEYQHINSLASKIKNNTRVLLNETRHYRHTASYAHMVHDLNEMLASAKHLRSVARYEGDIDHIAADLHELDRAFHHVEELFDATEAEAAHGNGHIHGNTRHVKKRLNWIEELIHHMQEDVEAIRARRARVQVCPYSGRPIATVTRTIKPVYGSSYGNHNSYRVPNRTAGHRSYDQGGITFSNGRVGFNFNF